MLIFNWVVLGCTTLATVFFDKYFFSLFHIKANNFNHKLSIKMPVEIITQEDLMRFKKDLIAELKEIMKHKTDNQPQWLKSPEVRKLLSISAGTLQTLRINGTLPYTKIGGVMYYATADIEQVMKSKRTHHYNRPMP